MKNKRVAAKILLNNLIESIPHMISEWQEFGIQEAFVLENLFINPLYQKSLGETNIKSWLIVQTFLNKDLTKNDPLCAILNNGKPAFGTGNGSWLKMVCPNGGINNFPYIKSLITYLKNLIKQYNPYGISLDFIRHFTFWEDISPETKAETLLQSCFCKNCLSIFQHKYNISVPSKINNTPETAKWILENVSLEWTEFKEKTITQTVRFIKENLTFVKPDLKFNIHAVPWKKEDHNNAIKRVAGQNFSELGNLVDSISPMCYSDIVKQSPSWINEVVCDIKKQTAVDVIPAFQGAEIYNSGNINDHKFLELFKETIRTPSDGLVLWPWEQINKRHKILIKKYL